MNQLRGVLCAYLSVLSLLFTSLFTPLSVVIAEEQAQDSMSVFRADMDSWKSQLGVADDTFKKTVNKFFGSNCSSSQCKTCLVVTTASKDDWESYTWIGTFTPSGPQTMYKGISATKKSGAEEVAKVISAPCDAGGTQLKCSGGQCCFSNDTAMSRKQIANGNKCLTDISAFQDVKQIRDGGTIGENATINWINNGIAYNASKNLMFHEGVACHTVGGRKYQCQPGSAGCVVIHPAPMKNFCDNVYQKTAGADSMFFVIDMSGESDYTKAAADNYAALKKKGTFCSSTPGAVSLGGPNYEGGISSLSGKGAVSTDPSLNGNASFTSCNESSTSSYPDRVESVREGESPEGFIADEVKQDEDKEPPGGTAGTQAAAAAAETMSKNCHLTLATESRTTGTNSNSNSSKGGGKGMLGAMIGIAAVGGIGAYLVIQNKKDKEEEKKEESEDREKEVYDCKKVVRDPKAFGSQKERCQAKIDSWEEEQAVKSAAASSYRENVSSLPEDEMMSTDSTLTVTNKNDSDNTREYSHSLIAHYDESRMYEHEYGQEEKKNTEIYLNSQAQAYTENADKQATATSYQDTGTDRMTQTLDGYQNIYEQRAALLKRDLDLVPTKSSLLSHCTETASRSGFDRTPVYDYLTAPIKPFIGNSKLEFDAATECASFITKNEDSLLTNKQIYSQAEDAIQDSINVVAGIQDIKDTLASQKLKGPELSKYLKEHPVLKELGKRQLELEACSELDCWNNPKTNSRALLKAYGPSEDSQVNYHYEELQNARATKRKIASYNVFEDPKFAPYFQKSGFSHFGTGAVASTRKYDFSGNSKKGKLKDIKSSLVKEGTSKVASNDQYQGALTSYAGGNGLRSGERYRDEEGVLRSKSGKPVAGFASPAHSDIFQLISHRYRQKFFSEPIQTP